MMFHFLPFELARKMHPLREAKKVECVTVLFGGLHWFNSHSFPQVSFHQHKPERGRATFFTTMFHDKPANPSPAAANFDPMLCRFPYPHSTPFFAVQDRTNCVELPKSWRWRAYSERQRERESYKSSFLLLCWLVGCGGTGSISGAEISYATAPHRGASFETSEERAWKMAVYLY